MKLKVVLSAVCALVLGGCNHNSAETAPTVGITTDQAVGDRIFTISTVYPDGAEYVSYDNGKTWFADGNETENPVVYFTADSENVYDLSHELYVTAKADGESFNYGKEPGLYYFTDNEYGLLYDYAYTQEALLLMSGAETSVLIYDPEMAESPSAGNYRYIKEFHDGQSIYTCCFDFYMGY
ncbi:MAG: hypothetical protein IJY73_08130 [Oscillospiraceae bacterium]|nr:hypothetical protein [Oscillospiraceae bacterium]